MSLIAFAGVTLDLGGRTVLSRVNLSIEPGEFVGLFGPNGAGKTTLLRAILGLVPPRKGTVSVIGRPPQRELGLGVLFSAHELNPLLGAMDRVLYAGGGRAVLGTVDAVITGPVLSRLYGSPIEVLRLGRRIVVMSADSDAEAEAHRHDHVEPVHVRL